MPEFAARADEREAAKRERLAPATQAALARRPGPRKADPSYVIAPLASGPAADGAKPSGDGGNGGGSGLGLGDLVTRLAERGEAALGAFVRRSDDRTLERTIGSDPGLRLVFAGMTRRFRPDRARDFEGDIQYELRPAAGAPRNWVVSIGDGTATARPGRAAQPRVTIGMDVADFARLISRELDPGRALMDGRLRLEGDVMAASRLGEMFGEPGY